METVSNLLNSRLSRRILTFLWQIALSGVQVLQISLQRLFQALFQITGWLISLLGLGRPNARQTALLLVTLAVFLISPQINLPNLDNTALADDIDEPFVYLEADLLTKPLLGEVAVTNGTATTYEVQPGDTTSAIASRFGITLNTILWANSLSNADMVRPGMKLKILPVSGLLYKVKTGDTIAKIAKQHKINQDIIAYQNNLELDSALAKNTDLILPGAEGQLAQPKRDIYIATSRDTGRGLRNNPGIGFKMGEGTLLFPVEGRLTQGFRRGHYGIDVANRALPPVFAAEGGTVVRAKYSGYNGGYGLNVIIDHYNGLQTLYAHMSEVYVQPGQDVGRGEAIGKVGNTGRSSGPHLHFETIANGRKTSPWNYVNQGAVLASK